MEKDVGKILKGEYQGNITEIVLAIKEFNGKVGLDIREYSSGAQYTGPTKKGLRIPGEKFKEFKAMVNSISENDLKSDVTPVKKQATLTPDGEDSDDAGIDEDGTM